MSRKKKTRKGKSQRKCTQAPAQQTRLVCIPKGDISFWTPFEEYNRLDSKLRADALKKIGIEVNDREILGQLTKSHFVIPGKTCYQCRQCGECCRYARKVATFTYEPCSFLGKDNLCLKHDSRYQVCKWFPFWVYPDKRYGNLLVIKPYCAGYGHGEPVDYEATVIRLLKLRQSTVKEPDGAEVIHEVVYLPTLKEWVFPSRENVNKLMRIISGSKPKKRSQNTGVRTGQLDHARRYTSGLLSSVNDANITVSEEGIITDGNDAAALLLGLPREQLAGTLFSDMFTNPEESSGILRTCLAVGKTTGLPHRLNNKKEKPVPALFDAITYRDEVDGMVHGILVAVRPVSEYAFNELKQARNYARGLIESSLDPMLTLTNEGIISDVNEAASSITGYSSNELIGAGFRDFFADSQLADIGVRRVFKEGHVRDYELELQSRSGETIPISFNAGLYRGVDGAILGAFAVARDIRNMRQELRKLKDARNYARGLIESSLDPMLTLTNEGIISDVNKATSSITGYSSNELIGAGFRDFFIDSQLADIGVRRVFKEGHVRDYELELQSRSGKTIPVSFNATEYRNAEGEILGVFAVAREKRGF